MHSHIKNVKLFRDMLAMSIYHDRLSDIASTQHRDQKLKKIGDCKIFNIGQYRIASWFVGTQYQSQPHYTTGIRACTIAVYRSIV